MPGNNTTGSGKSGNSRTPRTLSKASRMNARPPNAQHLSERLKMEFGRRHYRRRVVRSQPSTRAFKSWRSERSRANCDSLPSKSVRHGERNMSELADRQCVPCRGGVPPLKGDEVQRLLGQLADWQAVIEHHLLKTYRFQHFRETLAFVNRVAEIAEE